MIDGDASDFASGAILSQEVEGRLHPVAFHSRKLNKHEINYEIQDRESLAITSVFKEWRRNLEGAGHKRNVYTDYEGLKWFANNKPLNRRQVRWALELDGFEFQIIHRPGVKNDKPDTLSTRSEFHPEKGGQAYQPVEPILKPGQWIQNVYSENTEVIVSSVMIQGIRPLVKLSKDLEMEILEKAADDLIWKDDYDRARELHAVNGKVLADTTYKDGMLYHNGKIWHLYDEAKKKMVFENEHDTIVAGHMGMDKTLKMINRNFYWPRMSDDIVDYVRLCDDCQRNKASRHKKHGTLHSLELSYSPCDSISRDFITHLPVSENCSTV